MVSSGFKANDVSKNQRAKLAIMATLQGRTPQVQPECFFSSSVARTDQPSYMELATEEAQQQASAIVIPAWARQGPNRYRLNHLQDIKHGVQTKRLNSC